MAQINKFAYPGAFAEAISEHYLASVPVASGQPIMRDPAVNVGGEVIPVTASNAVHVVGLALDDLPALVTSQVDLQDAANAFPENKANTVRVIRDMFAVWSFTLSAAAAAGTALSNTGPANVLIASAADAAGLTIADANVGGTSRAGGLVVGLSGANKNIIRRVSGFTANTSIAVTVRFPHDIAAGDQFVVVPLSRVSQALTLTTDATEVNGAAAVNAGGAWSVVGVTFDLRDQAVPKVVVNAMAGNHHLNRLT